MFNEKQLLEIVNKFGIGSVEFLPMQKGYRNQSHPLKLINSQEIINLIIYKSEPDILKKIYASNEVSNYLADRGFPTRKMADDRILRLSPRPTTNYCALYNYLPGQTIPWGAYTMKHIKLLGMTLSNMHSALVGKKIDDLTDINYIYTELMARMTTYFNNRGVIKALTYKLNLKLASNSISRLDKYLCIGVKLPNKQALHLDFVRGNILFDQLNSSLAITGILDFEKTALGNKLFDIARTLAFLIVDCKYKDEAKVRKYFLQSGYNKRGKAEFVKPLVNVNSKKVDLFEEIVNFYLFYDFYKFLLHNPYEFLSHNEHYCRTRDVLINRNILQKA